MRMLLELDGHDVGEASGGFEGLRAALNGRYDIAFIDLHLPDIDGLEIARQLRESPAKEISLIALTGGSRRGHGREEALEAGFDAFLLKTVSPQVVTALLIDLPRKRV